jgi:hypothetical protein
LALGDITIYSKDNGNGYPGDINFAVATATTIPTILSGEPVTKTAGVNYPSALASGGPLIGGGPGTLTPLLGVAATTSSESTSGNVFGSVSVTPIDEPITYLIGTLATSTYFGNPATSQAVYDGMVGSRVTFARTGGVGSSQLGGTYTINATDATANGLIVEELDIVKYPGKVRFSFRNQLSYRQ